jgi:hypothetical protein
LPLPHFQAHLRFLPNRSVGLLGILLERSTRTSGHVDIGDFGQFSSMSNLSTGQTGFIAAFDFNGDGHIDIADFGQFSIRFFTMLP